MAKRDRVRQRKATRTQEQSKQRQTQIIAVGAVITVLAVAIIYFGFFGSNRTIEATERRLLDPVLGNPDAPIVLEEWAAFGCEACKGFHEQGIFDAILERYPRQVKIVFRDFPVIMPRYDQSAAEVAQCALDQGNEQFWLMHDWLYTQAVQGRTNQNQIVEAGINLGLAESALRSCVEADTHELTVKFDLQRGYEQGINATPTFFVNGQRMFSFQQVIETIEAEIIRLGL